MSNAVCFEVSFDDQKQKSLPPSRLTNRPKSAISKTDIEEKITAANKRKEVCASTLSLSTI